MKHCTDLMPDWVEGEGVGPTSGVQVPFESTSRRPYVLSWLSMKNPAATHHAAVTQLTAPKEPVTPVSGSGGLVAVQVPSERLSTSGCPPLDSSAPESPTATHEVMLAHHTASETRERRIPA